jgi:hypothetical protein
MLWVVMQQGVEPLMVNLRELINPHYELFCDYYGDVYTKYVGHMMVKLLGLFGFLRPLVLT